MIKVKKYFIFAMIPHLCISCNFSDSAENAPMGYIFIIEGGNQNRVIKNDELIIDSGLVEYKYSDKYIIFSVDTTYSMNPKKIRKDSLLYYLHDVEKDEFLKRLSYGKLKKIVKERGLDSEGM